MEIKDILASIEQELLKVPKFGQLQIIVKKHIDQFNSVNFTHIESTKMEGELAQMKAIEHIISMYRQAASQANENKKQTTLSITTVIDGNGRNVQVLSQDFKKR